MTMDPRTAAVDGWRKPPLTISGIRTVQVTTAHFTEAGRDPGPSAPITEAGAVRVGGSCSPGSGRGPDRTAPKRLGPRLEQADRRRGGAGPHGPGTRSARRGVPAHPAGA